MTIYQTVTYSTETYYETSAGYGILCDNTDIYCNSEAYYCDGSVSYAKAEHNTVAYEDIKYIREPDDGLDYDGEWGDTYEEDWGSNYEKNWV